MNASNSWKGQRKISDKTYKQRVASDKTHCKPFDLLITQQWVFGWTLCIQGINTCNDNKLACQHNQVTTIIAMIAEKCQMKRWRNSLLRNAESAWNSCVVDAHIRIAAPLKCLTRHWSGIAFQRAPFAYPSITRVPLVSTHCNPLVFSEHC